jgi:hypothetical protein
METGSFIISTSNLYRSPGRLFYYPWQYGLMDQLASEFLPGQQMYGS